MISYAIQKKWKYISPIISGCPEPLLKFGIKKFIKLQKKEFIGKDIPKRIVLFVTKKCNLRCKHCFYIRNTSSKQEMTLSQIKQLAFSARGKLKQVIFTGGEPFVREDFQDITLAFADNGVEVLNINTNGILAEKIKPFVDTIIERTEAKMIFMTSFDGPESIHDEIRGLPGAAKKTKQAISVLSECLKKYPSRFINVSVCTSINRLNIDHLPDIIAQIRAHDNISHIFNFTRSADLNTFGASKDSLSEFNVDKNILLDIEEMKKIFLFLCETIWEKPRSAAVLANRQILLETIRLMEKRPNNFSCLAGKSEIVIYPEGDVAVCEMLKPVGCLEETDYNLPNFFERHRKEFLDEKKCRCTHDCAITSSIRFSPQSLFEMIKKEKIS